MNKKIGITFCDFWPELDHDDNIFINTLRKIAQVELRTHHPDLVFFSYYGNTHFKYRCPKVFFTGENLRPDRHACDFSISFDYPVTDRNFRFPLYALYGDVGQLCLPKNPKEILRTKTKFCNFIVSNPQGNERNKFFKLLSKYKKVDSGGRYLNNIGHPVTDKNAFVKDYKFTLAFENSSYPGYTTEKIFQPMMMHSLPVYWGNPLVGKDFNTKSFINVHDYKNFDEAIDQIIAIDQSDDLYRAYLQQPYFEHNIPNEYVREENLLKFMNGMLNQLRSLNPVASVLYHRSLARLNYDARRMNEMIDFAIRNIKRKMRS